MTQQILNETLVLPNLRPDIYCGIRSPPKGILLYGPPGNGKTFIAKAIATECKAKFFNMSASSLVSKYCGESEKILRMLFRLAYIMQPSIIFIDEIDSILSKRSESEHEASRRLKTEFLVQFDGLGTTDQDRVFLIGATNRPQDLDHAVLRRFGKKVLMDVPEQSTRKSMIKKLMSEVSHELTEKQITAFAKATDGFTASDLKLILKEICNEPLKGMSKNVLISMHPNALRPVDNEDVLNVLANFKPSLTKKDLQEYYAWDRKFGKQMRILCVLCFDVYLSIDVNFLYKHLSSFKDFHRLFLHRFFAILNESNAAIVNLCKYLSQDFRVLGLKQLKHSSGVIIFMPS
eukprot:TRINITY_DN5980_c0_g1_i6.p1 TRINITY_DN5980_c0_g1~~TRINITY_DN5980_c0_g1_i6.p1  ORF type:complete len:347 (+),score=24.07 TRINITY_DN5980_c0_g1_i6:440-1480(+)